MVQTTPNGSAPPGTNAHRKQLEILTAASRVFRRRGLHATGMRDIAAESGMHVGNLYYYFRNKQELLAFCQKQTLSGLIELADRIRREPCTADEKLYRIIVGHVVRLNDEMPGSLAHLEVEALEQPWRKEILRRRGRYERSLRQIVEEGTQSGVFRPVDHQVVVKAILGSVNWTVKWYRPQGGRTSDQIGHEFATLLVGGLLAEGRKSPYQESASRETPAARSKAVSRAGEGSGS